MPSSHLILCHPLLLLPPIPPSIRVFSNESTLPMSQLAWGGQSTGVSALASVLPKKSQGWSPLEWTILIQVRGKLKSEWIANYCKMNFLVNREVACYIPKNRDLEIRWTWFVSGSNTSCLWDLRQVTVFYVSGFSHVKWGWQVLTGLLWEVLITHRVHLAFCRHSIYRAFIT